jgi:hypothetical protein
MKYSAFIISICNYAPQSEDSNVVNYSDVMNDHPFIPKPGSVIYDYVDLYKPMGRDPETGLPLWIDEPNTARRKQEVEEEGINSIGSEVNTPLNNPIDASLCNCQISADQAVTDIDEDPKYLIWGLRSLLEDPVYPVGKEDWQMDLPVSAERKAAFDAFMIARGTDPQVLADYWLAHPDATYKSVAEDFELFI